MTSRSDSPVFKDHFSGHAAAYSAHRPTYPAELFRFLADCCQARGHAWDCATGNGQTALALAALFERVTASDASAAQIEAAARHPRVEYRVATAERSGLADHSADLVTVSQALHWFDIDRFFEEAQRVLVAGGVLAAWSYDLCRVAPACDALIRRLYDRLDAYWPPERDMVEARYADVRMPMPEIAAPAFDMTADWTAEAMLGYLRTWSACQRCRQATGEDPLDAIDEELRATWGPNAREVRWPLALRIGRAP